MNPAAGAADSVTAVAAATVDTFPKASWLCTVTALEQVPAVTVCGPVVNTRWSAAAGVTVSACVGEGLQPPTAAVTVTLPGEVPLNQKLAALDPAPMVALADATVQPESE